MCYFYIIFLHNKLPHEHSLNEHTFIIFHVEGSRLSTTYLVSLLVSDGLHSHLEAGRILPQAYSEGWQTSFLVALSLRALAFY